MKKKWIGTGWKMNHLMSDAIRYTEKLVKFIHDDRPQSNIFVCVPYTVLYTVAEKLASTHVKVASQNMHWLKEGAVTGEISALMVKDTGASIVELGHSERRSMFGETDKMVNAKVKAALRNGLQPLICVGEILDDKESQTTMEKIGHQIRIALQDVSSSQADKILIAYEPVWAIGESGSPAKPAYADSIHLHIKRILCGLFGKVSGSKVPILYGGSVNQSNALDLICMPNIDGLFIGRAAWEADGFISIIRMVENYIKESEAVQ